MRLCLFFLYFLFLFLLTCLRGILKKAQTSWSEVTGLSQTFSFCSLMKWISVWEPHVPSQAHIGWTKIKLLSFFGLQTIQYLLTLKKWTDWKHKQERGLSWSMDASLWNAQTVQMTTSYSYRGFYFITDTGLDWAMFPLFLCHPSCVAALP